jgi:O-antigen/teichoic acid export membrane protein
MILRLFISAALANALGLGLGFLTHLSLAHLMDVETYGIFNFIFSIAVFVSFIAGLGFHASAQRIIPQLQTTAPERVSGFIKFARHLTIITAVLCAGLTFASLYFYNPAITDSAFYLYCGGSVLAVFMSLSRLQVGIFKSFKKGTLASYYDTVFRELIFLATIWLLVLAGVFNSNAALSIWIYAAIMIALTRAAAKQLGIEKSSIDIKDQIRPWLKISLPMMLLIASQMLLHRSDIIMLGFMTDFNEVGSYSFAAKISQACSIIFIAGTTIFSPRAAEFYQSGNLKALGELYRKMQLFMAVGTAGISIILIFIFPFILNFFDPSYASGINAFYILIGGYFLNALLGPSSYLMVMTRHEVTIMWVTFFSLFLNILLNIILIPFLGITGAAIATVVSLNLRNLAGYIIFITDNQLIEPRENHG